MYDYSISGALYTNQKDFYTSKTLSSCSGLSGAGVIESDRLLVAIHVGTLNKDGQCQDVAQAPNLTSDFDPKTCDKESGGASLACLSSKLPA